MVAKRNRVKQTVPLKERLATFAEDMIEKADRVPPGRERDGFLKRASCAETAAHLDDWANSPPLQPRK